MDNFDNFLLKFKKLMKTSIFWKEFQRIILELGKFEGTFRNVTHFGEFPKSLLDSHLSVKCFKQIY